MLTPEPIRLIIEITPQEEKNFKWELKSSYDFNTLVLIEALQKIMLKLHFDYVLEEIGTDPHDIDDNRSDET